MVRVTTQFAALTAVAGILVACGLNEKKFEKKLIKAQCELYEDCLATEFAIEFSDLKTCIEAAPFTSTRGSEGQRRTTSRPKVATSRIWITIALRDRSMPISSRWIIGLLNMVLPFFGSVAAILLLGDAHKSIFQVCLEFTKLGYRDRRLHQLLNDLAHLLIA